MRFKKYNFCVLFLDELDRTDRSVFGVKVDRTLNGFCSYLKVIQADQSMSDINEWCLSCLCDVSILILTHQ